MSRSGRGWVLECEECGVLESWAPGAYLAAGSPDPYLLGWERTVTGGWRCDDCTQDGFGAIAWT